jgi:exopolysaccharide production protein ExoQ
MGHDGEPTRNCAHHAPTFPSDGRIQFAMRVDAPRVDRLKRIGGSTLSGSWNEATMSMQYGEVVDGRILAASIQGARARKPANLREGDAMRAAAPVARLNLLGQVNTWILCFILLVFASTYGFSFQHGIENTTTGAKEQGVSASDSQEHAVTHIQNAVTYMLCLLLMLPLAKTIGTEFRRNVLISSLLFWALVSCFWSADASTSIINGLRMTLSIALAFYLFQRYAPNDLLKLLMLVGSVAAVGSVILIVVAPQYGLQGRDALYAFGAWQGIFGQKNICGRMMTLLLLPAFFVQLEGRWAGVIRFSYIVLLLVIIGMTRSAGSWFLCGACLAFITSIHLAFKLKRIDALTVGLVAAGMAAAVIAGVAVNIDAFLWMIGKDPTMTGRTMIWSSLMVSILKHPFLGYGYMAFWQGLNGESANTILQLNWPGMGYAENGVLELWLELGAVGVVLYAVVFAGAVKNAAYCFRQAASRSTLWYISILFYVAFTNLWAGNLLTASTLECILPFIAYAGLRRASRQIRDLQAV